MNDELTTLDKNDTKILVDLPQHTKFFEKQMWL